MHWIDQKVDSAAAGNGSQGHTVGIPPVNRSVHARIPTVEGEFQLYHYTNDHDGKEHLAIVMGSVGGEHGGQPVLVRVHSECFTGDVLGSRRCDCGEQLHRAMAMIAAAGSGVVIYLRQEGRGIGLADKLRAYNLQDMGYDTVEANLLLGHQADEREYWAAAAILADLKVRSIQLLTNNPDKIEHLRELGVAVEGRVPIETPIHADNRAYLTTKAQRMRHMLDLPSSGVAFPDEVEEQLSTLHAEMAAHAQRQSAMNAPRPFVTLTYAQSLDGSLAQANGAPLLLSSDESMQLTHHLRSLHDGILVGVGTILNDDPQLTARLGSELLDAQPRPVVLDSHLRTPITARVLLHPKQTIVATIENADASHASQLRDRGAEILALTADGGRVDLNALLEELGARGIQSLMVEGGVEVIRSFLAAGVVDKVLVDKVIVTIAPRYVGGMHAAPAQDVTLQNIHFTPLGADMILWSSP